VAGTVPTRCHSNEQVWQSVGYSIIHWSYRLTPCWLVAAMACCRRCRTQAVNKFDCTYSHSLRVERLHTRPLGIIDYGTCSPWPNFISWSFCDRLVLHICYAILSATTQFTSYAQNAHHRPKRTLAFSDIFPKQFRIFSPNFTCDTDKIKNTDCAGKLTHQPTPETCTLFMPHSPS